MYFYVSIISSIEQMLKLNISTAVIGTADTLQSEDILFPGPWHHLVSCSVDINSSRPNSTSGRTRRDRTDTRSCVLPSAAPALSGRLLRGCSHELYAAAGVYGGRAALRCPMQFQTAMCSPTQPYAALRSPMQPSPASASMRSLAQPFVAIFHLFSQSLYIVLRCGDQLLNVIFSILSARCIEWPDFDMIRVFCRCVINVVLPDLVCCTKLMRNLITVCSAASICLF